MAEARFAVRGLIDEDAAGRVEATLFSKVGVHEVKADWQTGELWISYDERLVPQPRLLAYIRSAGLTIVQRR